MTLYITAGAPITVYIVNFANFLNAYSDLYVLHQPQIPWIYIYSFAGTNI
ncbi:hypothetical protein [Vulcanisaeta distributa]|nr:hypothetical protein [Vulcanisaeta distributa]